jgi:hypothetical protein
MGGEDRSGSRMVSSPQNSGRTQRAGGQQKSHPWSRGVSILGFKPESAAENAGIKKGDLIIAYDGEGELTVERLSVLTATPGPRVDSIPMVFLRDGDPHFVTLQRGPLGISAMNVAIPDSSGMIVAQDEVGRRVDTIQKIYLALLAFALVGLSIQLLNLGNRAQAQNTAAAFFVVLLYAAIYFGLRHRVESMPTLVLIFSAFQCLMCFVRLMSPATDIRVLAAKVLYLLLLLFFAYQIWFFRRPEVRAHFKDTGVLVF